LLMGWERNKELQSSFRSPTEIARKLYYDNLVYDRPLMKHLLEAFGDSQLVLGTDYPYDARQAFPVEFAKELSLSQTVWDALRGGNAARFLGLP
jgi:aminocarboxymuconate-semialdehyde decarboxylase